MLISAENITNNLINFKLHLPQAMMMGCEYAYKCDIELLLLGQTWVKTIYDMNSTTQIVTKAPGLRPDFLILLTMIIYGACGISL